MRKYIVFACLLLSTLANGQSLRLPVKLAHYVLDSFTVGRVQVKSGKVYEQTLNYNILTNEMIFNNGGRLMAIADPADVDTITIAGRKFIPANNKFYEVLTNTRFPLLLEFTCKVDEPGASVGYGNASPTTNATSYSSLVQTGGVYDIKLPDDFKVIPGVAFWIKKEDRFLKAGSAKQLISIFPDKKEVIIALVKQNNTSFSQPGDLINLVEQIQH